MKLPQECRLRILPNMSAALSNLNSERGGHSMLMRIKASSVEVFKWFLSTVFIRFIAENEHSHLAVLTGIRRARDASLVKLLHISK